MLQVIKTGAGVLQVIKTGPGVLQVIKTGAGVLQVIKTGAGCWEGLGTRLMETLVCRVVPGSCLMFQFV